MALLFTPHRHSLPTDGKVLLSVYFGVTDLQKAVRSEEFAVHRNGVVQVEEFIAHELLHSGFEKKIDVDKYRSHSMIEEK